jgi:hypothetical protein
MPNQTATAGGFVFVGAATRWPGSGNSKVCDVHLMTRRWRNVEIDGISCRIDQSERSPNAAMHLGSCYHVLMATTTGEVAVLFTTFV